MPEDSTANKRALLVGINKYPYLPDYSQLRGCVNDVEAMSFTLREQFGFPAAAVTVLRDEEATQSAIFDALDRLSAETRKGDVVVFYFSGHGSQMTDREGDEPDGMDETIMPYDSGRGDDPNRDITDDDIYAWLLDVTRKTDNVTLIFDSCHSGSMARDPFGARIRFIEPDTRPPEQLPPSRRGAGETSRRDIGPSGWLPISQRYVLLAACRGDEGAYEHQSVADGRALYHGAFTFFLMRELSGFERGSTFRDVFERASLRLAQFYQKQHPQLEGTRDRELFGTRDIEPLRFIPVTEQRDGFVTIAAGAAYGVLKGSTWGVYPQATKALLPATARLGTLTVTSIGAVTSKAEVSVPALLELIVPGTRAVEELRPLNSARMLLEIDPAADAQAASELRAAVAEIPLLRLGDGEGKAAACVRLVGPRDTVKEGDPAPQLGRVSEPTWAVAGNDGSLIVPLVSASRADAAFVLCRNLETYWRYRNAIALSNRGSALYDKITFTLLRVGADGSQREAADGEVFEEGERIAFSIVNRHTSPVYLSILDFGLSGTISALYPVAGAAEPLTPARSVAGESAVLVGKPFEVGTRRGEEIELYMPDDFINTLPSSAGNQDGGEETFRLFVTTEPADFSWLTQHGYKGVRGGFDSRLEDLLHLLLMGRGLRETRRAPTLPEDDWTVIDRRIFLRRKRPHE